MYLSPINYVYDANGKISAYSADMLSATKLRSYLSEHILDNKSQSVPLSFKITLGTLTGVPFLYGKGPEFTVKLTSLNYVNFNVASEFSDSGINQTLHKIILEVEATLMIEEPLSHSEIKINSSLPLSETVIVGDVPGAYTVIIRASEDDEEDINDYGASAN